MTGQEIAARYDVIIMGGGPAGSTLAALLRKRTELSIAVFDKAVFPREHIGESFAHPLIPVLEESGVLPKVMPADFSVQKFGGIFNWGNESPSIGFFDHAQVVQDGVYRWAMHVNRAEFDHVLLDHAAELGADVFQGVSVTKFDPDGDGCVVTLKDGRTVRGSYFVDASGRRNSIAAKQKRAWLSSYRNIAIWQHFYGGERTQSLPGDWNFFREPDLSPIGCFAFEDGWCWYIPVRKVIDGERRLTHSIGIVTSPDVLKEPGKDFTDQETFLRTVRKVPMLDGLIENVSPVAPKMLTATNYSMINERFADFDERWMLVGDAAYFVDPLFSSGVAFAANQAAAAATAIEAAFRTDLTEEDKRDLWQDYDVGWHGMAETFALSIDQWYHAIGKKNPGSVYWRLRGSTVDLDIQERTFDALLNTAFTPDLLQVMAGSDRLTDLDREGPFMKVASEAEPEYTTTQTRLALSDKVTVRRGVGLEVPGFKAAVPPPPFELPAELTAAITEYWRDPVSNGATIPSPSAGPQPCHRFAFQDRPDGIEVRGLDRDGAAELWELLSAGPRTVDELERGLSVPQMQLLKRLVRAGMVEQILPASSNLDHE